MACLSWMGALSIAHSPREDHNYFNGMRGSMTSAGLGGNKLGYMKSLELTVQIHGKIFVN